MPVGTPGLISVCATVVTTGSDSPWLRVPLQNRVKTLKFGT